MIGRKAHRYCNTFLCALTLLTLASTAQAGVDRYGGVWNEGVATGPFVPLAAGMSFNKLQTYMSSWEQYRITDLEVVTLGCPSAEVDLFASQWEEGSWKDVLEVYNSQTEFDNGLNARCAEGFKLIDFEIWSSVCRETGDRFIALYTDQEGCEPEPPPSIHTAVPDSFSFVVDLQNEAGMGLVDFESVGSPFPTAILGVFYAGNAAQTFGIYERPSFEQEMRDADGERKLVDMESYLHQVWQREGPQTTRLVAGLWDIENDSRDDHEVGEVYPKFQQLLFKDWSTRRLVDFEAYPNTWDRRFDEVFSSHLGNNPVAWGVSVLQLGEDVGSSGGGLATRPDPAQGLNAIPMTQSTPGVTASVTKFVTAVGVIAYAETQTPQNSLDWLDQPIVNILPPDFVNLGAGVELLTPRDFLRQRTGLANFSPTTDPIQNPASYRSETVAWLQQPVLFPQPPPSGVLPFIYQNAHFDLLALTMAELVGPLYPNSQDPWRDWVNDNVLSNVGIGSRGCGWKSTDARSYPFNWSMANFTWMPQSYPCAGYGTGAAMWFLSPDDLARLAYGVRSATLVDSNHSDEVFALGLGLDHPAISSVPYVPSQDGFPGTLGEVIHSKNGGVGNWVAGELVGTETLVLTYDDYNFDDDSFNLNEYSYEIGATEFDIGIAVHSSSIDGNDPCLPEDSGCDLTRLYPGLMTMILEAFRQPEAW